MNTTDAHFTLKPEFVAKYADLVPPFGFSGLGLLTYQRTYSRVKDDGQTEQWFETVERVVNGTYTMQKRHILSEGKEWNEEKAQESAQIMYEMIYNMKFTPPGRGLWAMGSGITEKKELYAALNNCAFVSTRDIALEYSKSARFLMDMSMLGVGVGFDTAGAGTMLVNLPTGLSVEPYDSNAWKRANGFMFDIIERTREKLAQCAPDTYLYATHTNDLALYTAHLEYIQLHQQPNRATVHIIEDTREGWVESVGLLIDSYLRPGSAPVLFDYTGIRPSGIILKTFGGVSSGPDPLVDLHVMLRKVLDANAGKPITITTITDIMNLIGKTVVAGNVRRCLPKGTRVHVHADGKLQLVEIEKVTKQMEAVYYEDGQLQRHKIIDCVPSMQYLTRLSTECGQVLTAMTHTFAVAKFRGAEMSGYMQAGFLARDDEIILSIHDDLAMLPVEHRTAIVTYMKNKHGVREKDIKNGQYRVKITENPNVAPNLQGECYDLTVEGGSKYAIEQGYITHNSSEIALGPADEEFLNLKNYMINPARMQYGWCSNNSVVITNTGVDYSRIAERIRDNGEPGIFWLNNARNYSRMGEHSPDFKDHRATGTNPCSEQTLESYELCCLAEIFLNRVSTLEDFLHTIKYTYLYAKTVTLGRSHWPETNEVMMRNRRIGVSVTGIAQFLGVHTTDDLKEWLTRGYDEIQKYDAVYSSWFCIPRSIKTTSVKPSGCVSLDTKIKEYLPSEDEVYMWRDITINDLFQDCGVKNVSALASLGKFGIDETPAFTLLNDFSGNYSEDGLWLDIRHLEKYIIGANRVPRIIKKLFVRGNSRAYKITFDDGSVVTCSPEHKFLTKSGLVEASRLSVNQRLPINGW